MQQCENCHEWIEDVVDISWPCEAGQIEEIAVYWVCGECFDHLIRLELKFEWLPEIGSEAAQRGYHHE